MSAPVWLLYLPLFGLEFDSEGVGAISHEVALYVPDVDEWRTVQKTDVFMAQWRNESVPSAGGPRPPCCIVVSAGLPADKRLDEVIREDGERLQRLGRQSVTALRLYRAGWFLSPDLAFATFYAPTLPLNIIRAPGPYRQAFVGGCAELPMPGYRLSIKDLNTAPAASGSLSAVWNQLEACRSAGRNSSVEIAIESFDRSYGYQLRPASRAAELFTALDAMIGGMSARQIGTVRVNPRGFTERIAAALKHAADPAIRARAVDEARWLNALEVDGGLGGRGLRNAIAHSHGQAVEVQAAAQYSRLRAIVCELLLQYVALATRWMQDRAAISERLRIATESPLTGAYLRALDAEVSGTAEILDLLSAV